MAGTILIAGHGPGISDAVARRFGKAGYSVALVARDAQRLASAAAALELDGITAQAFPCDVSDPNAVRRLVRDVRGALGPIAVLHWNAYAGLAGDLTTASSDDLRKVLDVAIVSPVAAAQEALADLEAQKGAILITGGGFATYDPNVDAAIVKFGAMALGVSKAAQHKLAGILHEKLGPRGVFVGEVMVLGAVKGTAFDGGQPGTLDPHAIAEAFFQLCSKRDSITVRFPA
jgi:NAD(P)-dependent dehydrogenase (short-subunit alcohol dehydrogenase family)